MILSLRQSRATDDCRRRCEALARVRSKQTCKNKSGRPTPFRDFASLLNPLRRSVVDSLDYRRSHHKSVPKSRNLPDAARAARIAQLGINITGLPLGIVTTAALQSHVHSPGSADPPPIEPAMDWGRAWRNLHPAPTRKKRAFLYTSAEQLCLQSDATSTPTTVEDEPMDAAGLEPASFI